MRRDVPFFERGIAWLDNAATTQRPAPVLDAVADFQRFHNANVYRSVHRPGAEATALYEQARAAIAAFIGAPSPDDIIFTSGTTAAVNMLVHGLVRPSLQPGDEVWVSAQEHHSNWVPWQIVAQKKGASFNIIPLTPAHEIDLDALRAGLAAGRAKWVAVNWVSNVLGVENDIRPIAGLVHAAGARLFVDGAQGVAHLSAAVHEWNCDAFAFSGHKMYATMGSGALWCRAELAATMEPLFYGGEMIARVDDADTTFAAPPHRFEGGTPNVDGAVGLAAAIRWLAALPAGHHDYVKNLNATFRAELAAIPGIRIWSHPSAATLTTFTMEGIHAHDVAQVLDDHGVAVRAGHMCAQPLLRRLGLDAAVRAAFAPYNTQQDIRRAIEGIHAAREIFQ